MYLNKRRLLVLLLASGMSMAGFSQVPASKIVKGEMKGNHQGGGRGNQ